MQLQRLASPKSSGEAARLEIQGKAGGVVQKSSSGRSPSSLGEVSLFIQVFNLLDNAQSYYGGQSVLLSPLILMLNSPKNTLQRDIQNNV